MAVDVGDAAPDFSLPGTGGRTYTLAEHRGAVVVLVFYPGDDTTVCTRQLSSYNHELEGFDELGAQLLGISPQAVESHERFAERHDFRFPLLADTEKTVADAYGVTGPLGFYRRSVFVIDGEGVVRYAHRAIAGLTYRPVGELQAAVRAARSPA